MVDISHMYITVFVYDIDQKRPPVVHWVYGTQTLYKNHLYKEALNISLIVNSCLNMSLNFNLSITSKRMKRNQLTLITFRRETFV